MTAAPPATTRAPPRPAAGACRAGPTPAAAGLPVMAPAVAPFSTLAAPARAPTPAQGRLQVVCARHAGRAPTIGPLPAHRPCRIPRTRPPGVQMARSVPMSAATAPFFAAPPHIGPAEAAAIPDPSPVVVTLGAAVFPGGRVGPRGGAGIAVAPIGALPVLRPGTGVFTAAALLPHGAAVCRAAVVLPTRRIRQQDGVRTAPAFGALPDTLATAALPPRQRTPSAPPGAAGLAAVGIRGATARFCPIRAVRPAGAAAIAPLRCLGLVSAAFRRVFALDGVPDAAAPAGGAPAAGAGLRLRHRTTRAAHGPAA